jgi:hypothetical protein
MKSFFNGLLQYANQTTQDRLGWILVVLLTLAGSLELHDLLTGLSCYAMAVVVCPRVPIPDWIRVLFVLLSLYILTHADHDNSITYR